MQPRTEVRASALEALVDGRRPGSGKLECIDVHRADPILAPRIPALLEGEGRCEARQGTSEALRQPCSRSTTPRQGGAAFGRRPARLRPSPGDGSVSEEVEAEVAPSSAVSPGVGSPRGGPAPHSSPVRRASVEAARRGWSRDSSRARDSDGPRVLVSRASVAEVDEKHLSHVAEGTREGSRGGAG